MSDLRKNFQDFHLLCAGLHRMPYIRFFLLTALPPQPYTIIRRKNDTTGTDSTCSGHENPCLQPLLRLCRGSSPGMRRRQSFHRMQHRKRLLLSDSVRRTYGRCKSRQRGMHALRPHRRGRKQQRLLHTLRCMPPVSRRILRR